MNKFFENINTLEELRKQYKELLKQHHPDNGGDLEIMQAVNAEYDKLFKILKNQHESNYSSDSGTANTNYNNMKYDFAEDKKKSKKSLSMDDIRNYYGSIEIKPERRVLLQA